MFWADMSVIFFTVHFFAVHTEKIPCSSPRQAQVANNGPFAAILTKGREWGRQQTPLHERMTETKR
jgi:hypothetical protein